ncbi:MAG: amidase [Hyphomicrobiaceae bacterium]|jgi:Asp-tRNA(Asn)/Glu-tRNA(Gln) amidotransferase A subunit family amidase
MHFDEYRKHDATALAALIAKREVSPAEVLETAIARAEQVNPAINAIVHKQYERARKEIAAGLPGGPLAGVPYLIKDLAFLDKGEPARLGSSLFNDYVADHDSAYLTRCRKAGLVIFGRTSTPEFGLNPTTEARLYGPTRNPWNLEHSPGGSSGGAAAAVIAGVLPVAHATDGGGSIRIPAAQCGLFGLKPTRARISMAPDAGEGWGGLSVGHVVSRSVRDSALMLDCTAGTEPGDPYAAPTPERPFVEELKRPAKKLKIAMMLQDHRGAKLHPECEKAVRGAAKLCASLGHIVEETDPKLDLAALRPLNATIAAANVARNLGLRWRALGRDPNPADVERGTWAVYQRGLKVTGVQYVEAMAAIHAAGRRMAAFLSSFDVILSTVLAGPPPKLGYLDQNGDPAVFAERVNAYLSVTPLHNATGTPAMSVPLHWTTDGLPVGVHFAGRYGEEATLLRLAAQLEQAQPWFDRVPAL